MLQLTPCRYDLLCLEGIARALRIFLQKESPPNYTLSVPAQMQEVFVESSVSSTARESHLELIKARRAHFDPTLRLVFSDSLDQ